MWSEAVRDEWVRREAERGAASPAAGALVFPLVHRTFGAEEVLAMADVLLDARITMGARVQHFEEEFARTVGAPFAVMVNSGSSANLLAVAAAVNHARAKSVARVLQPGDEVLVPAVCWSTSMWPLVQCGLRPVLVDARPDTLNVDEDALERAVVASGGRVRALMLVHVLGMCCDMERVMQVAARHGLLVFEDTCESLGTLYKGRMLGTFGAFGTYSFYYSHHITTGEGGMVVCHSQEDYDLLQCLRSHGWSRSHSQREQIEARYADVDPRFLFINTGFNLRPTEVSGAMGLCQLAKLPAMNAARKRNYDALVAAVREHPRFAGQFTFLAALPGVDAAYFGFSCMLAPQFAGERAAFLRYLSEAGIENRPIISGNMARQPALAAAHIECPPASAFAGAEEVHQRGFFLGLHVEPLDDDIVRRVAHALCSYASFARE